MSLDMLFQVLGTLEGFTAEVALVWLQRYMDTNMRSDMITLDSGGLALIPLASKVQVVGALAANMLLTYVLIESFGSVEFVAAAGPAAGERVILGWNAGLRSGGCRGGWRRCSAVGG